MTGTDILSAFAVATSALLWAAAAVAWAGTKPSANLRGVGEGLSTDDTDYYGLGEKVLDRIDKIDRISEADATSLSNPVNPVNPVKKQADGAEIGNSTTLHVVLQWSLHFDRSFWRRTECHQRFC